MELAVYNTQGQETGRKVVLSDAVFGVEANDHAIYLDVKQYLADQRQGTHKSKQRNEVAGSTRKLKRQKGTGGARCGSIKSPLFPGGGRVFGPVPRDYSFKVNSKVRALALKMALSSRLAAENLLVVKAIELPEAKTKHFAKVADTLGLTKALIVTPEDNEALARSARNIPGLTLTTPDRLSVLEVLRHKQLVLLEGAVSPVQARFEKKGA